MRFMMMIRANRYTESGELPQQKAIEAMMTFNEEMAKAGVLLGADGLQPSSKGARVRFANGKPTVIDGPFPETKELIAGFWTIKVTSKEEAIEWARRIPFAPDVHFDGNGEVELRQLYDAEDFGDTLTPELREAEARLRDRR